MSLRYQHPQAEWVLHNLKVLPPHLYMAIAHLRLTLGSQGAFPSLHCPQLILLICHNPTSVDPFVL